MAFGSWTEKLFNKVGNVIGGTSAVTVQPYIELNVKRGRQFFINEVVQSVSASGGTKEYLIRTGPDPVLLKQRVIKTNSDDVDYEVFVGGTLSVTADGTPVTIRNANGVSPLPTQLEIYEDPTFTGTGNLSDLDWIPGAELQGNRSEGSFSTEGFEKVIPGNTDFIVRFTNNGGNPTKMLYFLTWYEGVIDVINA